MIYDVHPCAQITEITILTPWKNGGQLATVGHQKGYSCCSFVTWTYIYKIYTPHIHTSTHPPQGQMPATVRLVNSLIATLKTISPSNNSSTNNDLPDRHHTLTPLPPQRAPPHPRRISPPKLTLLTHPHLPPPRHSAPAAPQHPRLLQRLLYHSPLLGCRIGEQTVGGADPLQSNNLPGVSARHSYSQPRPITTAAAAGHYAGQTRRLSR